MNCIVNRIIRLFAGGLFIGSLFLQSDAKAQSPQNHTPTEVYRNDIKNRFQFLSTYSKSLKNIPANIRSAVDADVKTADVGTLDNNSYKTLRQKSRTAYLELLKRKVNMPASKLYAEVCNPWQDFKTDLMDISQVGNAPQSIQINNYINAQQYAAFWICNMSNTAQAISLSLSKNTAISQIAFYEAKYVLSRNYKYTPDALVPVTTKITMQPGEVKFFMMSQIAKTAGSDKFNIQIKGPSGSRTIPVSTYNSRIMLDKNGINLNTVNWAYYFYPMLQGKEAEATKNLRSHYTNSIVIPVEYLPSVKDLVVTPKFAKYVPFCREYKNIMLILDIRKQSKSKDYLSEPWKAAFLKWYDLVLNEFRKQGIDPAGKNIYLYAVDEATPAEVPYLVDFLTWIRKANPKIKLYATVHNKVAREALMPLLDVTQILSTSLMSVDVKDKDMRRIWLYDTKRKWYEPYQSYRLMAWEAFYKGYGGIGFWNYADFSKTSNNSISSWDDFDGGYADYNAIYDNGNKILNSRRWEAFKVGLEDYYVLQLFAKKYGDDQAKNYCYKVLTQPKDNAAADSIRNVMLSKL